MVGARLANHKRPSALRSCAAVAMVLGIPCLDAAEPHHDGAAVRHYTLPALRSGPDGEPATPICGVPTQVEQFRPVQDPLPVQPPADAVVLFGDGSEGKPRFTAMDGGPLDWKVEVGTLVVTQSPGHVNHAVSTEVFRDADIHAEFLTSPVAKGNSGLYIHGLYEMQIFDSFGVELPTDQDEGSLYRFAKPLVNAARKAGEWQVYDVRYRAPRRDADGTMKTPGTITAWLNGKLVQDGVEFTEPRSPYVPYRHGVTDHLRDVKNRLDETGQGPLFLQDHGSPTRFRNVWIRRLDDGEAR